MFVYQAFHYNDILISFTPFWETKRRMINRDRIDIINQILKAANGGANKTRVMYKVNLSYAQLKKILTALTEKDLIRYDKNTRILWTTEKGLMFLDIYNRMSDMIEEGQQQHQMWIHREEEV